MKVVKLIIAIVALLAMMGSCKSKACPGYGDAINGEVQTEQYA